MEYIAFLLLGLGLLLVLAGVLLQANERRKNAISPLDEYAFKSTRTEASSLPPLHTSVTSPSAGQVSITGAPAGAPGVSAQPVPGPFQFMQHEAPAQLPPQTSPVAVSVGQANPRLFEKFAYLYLDSSARNVYDGSGSVAAFDLSEVQGIRRFGRGLFSYDGFGFYFDHATGQERFPLANLKTIGFYPNCVALTFRTRQPVALLFMEETETIRKVLETFRAEAAGST